MVLLVTHLFILIPLLLILSLVSTLNFDTTLMSFFVIKIFQWMDHSVQIYDDNMTLLWYSADYSDIASDNTEIIPIVARSTSIGKHGQKHQ